MVDVLKCDKIGPCKEQAEESERLQAYQVVKQCCKFCGVNLVQFMTDVVVNDPAREGTYVH